MSPLVCCRGGMIFYRKSGFYGVGLHHTLLLAEKVIFNRCAKSIEHKPSSERAKIKSFKHREKFLIRTYR